MKRKKIISVNILPCPFCGCTDIVFDMHECNAFSDTIYTCTCINCLSTGPSKSSKRGHENGNRLALAAWNRRGEEK